MKRMQLRRRPHEASGDDTESSYGRGFGVDTESRLTAGSDGEGLGNASIAFAL